MKRRNFLVSLFALPAAVTVAAKAKPAQAVVIGLDPGAVTASCTLTRATIRGLTPDDIMAMGEMELNHAHEGYFRKLLQLEKQANG